jgi:hypothetical protein
MGTKAFPVGQVHDNVDRLFLLLSRSGDRVEVKDRDND